MHDYGQNCRCICNDGKAYGPPTGGIDGQSCDPALDQKADEIADGVLCGLFALWCLALGGP